MAARAHEQRCVESVLELADLDAQRRLRDVETGGGTTEVQLLGDRDKVRQKSQVH